MYDKVLGNHIGIVVNDQDPEKRSRLQVFIPHLSNTIYSGWNDQLTDVSFKTFESGIFSPEIIQKLKDVLPWAESAVPCFGGGTSGHVNSFLGKAITNPFSNALAATQSLGEAAYNAAANAFNDLSKGYDNPTSQNLNSEGNAPINNPPVNGSLTFGSTAYGNVDIDPTTAQDIAQGKITFDDQFKGASGRTLEPGVSIASNSLPMGAWVKLTNSAGEPLTNQIGRAHV